ncbi:hypothetical protein RhiirA4_483931, partial [Rhizophagus irregularis]
FEASHVKDFRKTLKEYKNFPLGEYEKKHIQEDIVFGIGELGVGIRDATKRRGADIYQDTLTDIAVFTMKTGGDILKVILESLINKLRRDGAANDTAAKELQEKKDELNSWITKYNKEKEKIDNLEKEKKIAEERIKNLENDVIKLKDLEQKKATSESSKSSKLKSKTKSHNRRRKNNKKKSSTQEINKGKITEIPVQTTSDDDFLENHFAEQSRDLKFYDFPAYWKDNEIYEALKQVGYIERLEVKWNYKYRTVRARIRLTKAMEEIFTKGGSNIAIKRNNDQLLYCRFFDAKLSATEIKKRYEWQAYQKIKEVHLEMKDHEILKNFNSKFGGHFSKIIKINKVKHILIYFNNENDLLNAIYKSNMEENIGEGLKIKSQDELIGGDNGTYKKRFGINRFKIPQQTKTQEEHDELDNLNENFKERLEEVNKEEERKPDYKGKKKALEISDDDKIEEKTNNNKSQLKNFFRESNTGI